MDTREKPLSRNVIYRGKILNLRVDKVELPGGKKAVREIVEHEPAVAVLPVAADGRIFLIRQFRYALGEEILEIPAGIAEKGENPEETARRELQEEVGFFPGILEEIGRIYNSPGFSTELLFLFLARDLKPSRLEMDDDEFIEVYPVHRDRIPSLLAEGKIRDGKTFAALSWFLAFRNQRG